MTMTVTLTLDDEAGAHLKRVAADQGRTPHIHGTGIYFNNQLFVHGENNAVHVFAANGGPFSSQPLARGTDTASWGTASPGGLPGGILALSSNGTAGALLSFNVAFVNLLRDTSPEVSVIPKETVSLTLAFCVLWPAVVLRVGRGRLVAKACGPWRRERDR